jgi:hypothetical protein
MARERLVQAYGEEEVLKIETYKTFSSPREKVWLCRDCIVLGHNGYLEVRGNDVSAIISTILSIKLGHRLSPNHVSKKAGSTSRVA